MRNLFLSIMLIASSAVGASAQDTSPQEDVENIVAVVTHDNPQIQMMSMVLSVQAAERGVNVHVLLCGRAADMALKDAPEAVTKKLPPLQISVQTFMSILARYDNATIEVCALYLPGNDKTKEALLDGIGIANPGQMAALLVDSSARVISF